MKEYRVRFWHSDKDGTEDFMEFDTMEQAQRFYDDMEGMAEIQKYDGERHDYEAIVYPEFGF